MRLISIVIIFFCFQPCIGQTNFPNPIFSSDGLIITEDHSKNNFESAKFILKHLLKKHDTIIVAMELPFWLQDRINQETQSREPDYKFLKTYTAISFRQDFIRKLEYINRVNLESSKFIKVHCFDRCGLYQKSFFEFLANYGSKLKDNSQLYLKSLNDVNKQSKLSINEFYDIYDSLLIDLNLNQEIYKMELMSEFKGFKWLMTNIGAYLVKDDNGDTYISSQSSYDFDKFRESLMENMLSDLFNTTTEYKLVLIGKAHTLRLNPNDIVPCIERLDKNFDLSIIIQDYIKESGKGQISFGETKNGYYHLTNSYK